MMIGKQVALIQVPNGRLVGVRVIGTIRILADLNIIKARAEFDTADRPRHVFTLEDLNAYANSLEPWYIRPMAKNPDSARMRCMGIYNGEGSLGEETIHCQQVLAEWIRSSQNVRPQLPKRTGDSNTDRGQHPGRHLEVA